MPSRRTRTATPTPTHLKAEIGRFDGEMHNIHFNQGDSIQTLFSKIDTTIHDGESVTNIDGENVIPSSQAEDGAVYYLTGNYKQG